METRVLSDVEARRWASECASGTSDPPPLGPTVHELLSRLDGDRSKMSRLITYLDREGRSMMIVHQFLVREEGVEERLAAEAFEKKRDLEMKKLEEEKDRQVRARDASQRRRDSSDRREGSRLRTGGELRQELEDLLRAAAKDYYGEDTDLELVGEQALLRKGSKVRAEDAERRRRQRMRAFFGDSILFLGILVTAVAFAILPSVTKVEAIAIICSGWLVYAIASKMDCVTRRGETARDRLDRLVDGESDDDAATAQMLADAAAVALRASKESHEDSANGESARKGLRRRGKAADPE